MYWVDNCLMNWWQGTKQQEEGKEEEGATREDPHGLETNEVANSEQLHRLKPAHNEWLQEMRAHKEGMMKDCEQ